MSPPGPGTPPRGRDTAYLAALGAAARTAPTAHARRGHREAAVHEAERHCLAGASWHEVAAHLGVAERTLRRWRDETNTVKRHGVAPAPSWLTTAAAAGQPYRVTERSTAEPGNLHAHVGRTYELPPQPVAAHSFEPSRIVPGAWRLAGRRDDSPPATVLLLTGHSRDGHLRFDQENQIIRGLFWGTSFTCHTECSVAAVEIAALLDKHMPRILHLCAHHAYDGPWLAQEGQAHAVSWPIVAGAIRRSSAQLAAAVVNVCDSTPIAAHLATGVPAVITCRDQVRADTAVSFTRCFYTGLVAGRSIHDSYQDAVASTDTADLYQIHMHRGDTHELDG